MLDTYLPKIIHRGPAWSVTMAKRILPVIRWLRLREPKRGFFVAQVGAPATICQ